MVNLLIRLFIKDYENINNAKVREKYGMLSGGTGVVCNVLLSALKFIIGVLTNSISITADAINNLSDAGSSTVTLAGFKLSNRPADKEHPFGHGRFEYLASLIVSFVIFLMGFELIKSSFERIISPRDIVFSYPALIALSLSVLVKLWLAYFNHKLSKRIKSNAISAVIVDSLSDTAVTLTTIFSLVLSKFSDIPFDGYCGLLVALLILFAGYKIIRQTTNDLLGQPPSPEFVEELQNKILSYEGILGVHDLIVHDYGPSRRFASVHAEVDAAVDINISHDIIDNIEKDVAKAFNILLVIHMDPITNSDEVNGLKQMTENIVKEINPDFSIHDFRVVAGPSHTNFIFDLVIPMKNNLDKAEIIESVSGRISAIDESYYAVITVENGYI